MKSVLKAPVTKHLKLKYDEMLSSCAFKFNLRRYTKAGSYAKGFAVFGALYTVRRCRLTPG
jgi:hypothetical protein